MKTESSLEINDWVDKVRWKVIYWVVSEAFNQMVDSSWRYQRIPRVGYN